jgi:hypothetical protein
MGCSAVQSSRSRIKRSLQPPSAIPVAARSGVGLRPFGCWDRGFDSRLRHGCLSVVFICCVFLCR